MRFYGLEDGFVFATKLISPFRGLKFVTKMFDNYTIFFSVQFITFQNGRHFMIFDNLIMHHLLKFSSPQALAAFTTSPLQLFSFYMLNLAFSIIDHLISLFYFYFYFYLLLFLYFSIVTVK